MIDESENAVSPFHSKKPVRGDRYKQKKKISAAVSPATR